MKSDIYIYIYIYNQIGSGVSSTEKDIDTLALFAIANRTFFYSLPINLSFLCLPGCFWASHDPVSLSCLKILWLKLLDFPTYFEISTIESLSSLRYLTISFPSSNDVTEFWAMITINLVKYPILYSYSQKLKK